MKKLALILVLLLSFSLASPAFAFSAQLSAQNLSVNGNTVQCEKYNIDGSNYFKLRDLAQLLNGTGSQFDVGWDAAAGVVSITTNHAYTTPNGTELVVGEDQSATAQVSAQTIMIDGVVRTDLTVYNIGGSNFFKLREMGEALGFDVDYNGDTNTAIVISKAEAYDDTLTIENLQGVWYYRHETEKRIKSVPNTISEGEMIISGNTLKEIEFSYDDYEYVGEIITKRILGLDNDGNLLCEIEQVELFNCPWRTWTVGYKTENYISDYTGKSLDYGIKSYSPTLYDRADQAVVEAKIRDRAATQPEGEKNPAMRDKYRAITLDNLQGVWYASSLNDDGQMTAFELIISGNTLSSVIYYPQGNSYSILKQTIASVDSAKGVIYLQDYEFQSFNPSDGYRITRISNEDVTNDPYIGQMDIQVLLDAAMKARSQWYEKKEQSTITDTVISLAAEAAKEDLTADELNEIRACIKTIVDNDYYAAIQLKEALNNSYVAEVKGAYSSTQAYPYKTRAAQEFANAKGFYSASLASATRIAVILNGKKGGVAENVLEKVIQMIANYNSIINDYSDASYWNVGECIKLVSTNTELLTEISNIINAM